jgi:hypothetical protein
MDRHAVPVTESADERTERRRLARIDELLALAGVRSTVEHLGASATSGIPESVSVMQGTAVARALADAFSPPRLYPALREAFRKRLDDDLLDAALRWYRSRLARRFVALERDAMTGKAAEQVGAFGESLRRQPPAEERLMLVDRLDAATGLTEGKLEIAAAIVGAASQVVVPLLPADMRPASVDIEAAMAQTRSAQREIARQTSLVTMLFAYRSVSDGELRRYVEFCETEAKRAFSEAVRGSLIDAMQPAAEQAMKEAARMVSHGASQAVDSARR